MSGWVLHDSLLHRLRSWTWEFFNTDISQGSVVTHLRCGGIVNDDFVANLLINLSVKEFWKSVNIWQSYGQYYSGLFLLADSVLSTSTQIDLWKYFLLSKTFNFRQVLLLFKKWQSRLLSTTLNTTRNIKETDIRPRQTFCIYRDLSSEI